jgi:transcription termination/antitermination protein NusG
LTIETIDLESKGGEALLSADHNLNGDDVDDDRSPDLGVESAAAWYAIWTRSHCERLVAQQLMAKGFTPFLPEMAVRPRKPDAASIVQRPMFPGYLFLKHSMEKRSYIEILKARGVVRILEGGWHRLTPIADEEMHAIERVIESGATVQSHPYFNQGDRVRVVEGPLAGLEGVFVRDKKNRGRLVVSVKLLQTSVAIEVDGDLVMSCDKAC